MGLKGAFYKGFTGAWMILVLGAWAAIDQGYTEPWLSFADVPGGSVGGMAVALVAILGGAGVIGASQQRHESGEWQAAGRQAGFEPAGDGTLPELTGTVDGRAVTARYERRKRGGGAEDEVRWVPFTSVEAELSGPVDEGVVVGPVGGELHVEDGVGTIDFEDVAASAATADGLVSTETEALVALGMSTAAAEHLVDGVSGDAIRAIGDLQVVSAGDASGVVARWADARNEELEGSMAEYPVENLVERVPGDATTVTVETKAAVRDGEDLRRFAEGVVAIADTFEESITPGQVSR